MRRVLCPISALVLVLALLPVSSTFCLLRCERAAARDRAEGPELPLGSMPCGMPVRCGQEHPGRATLQHPPAPVGHLQPVAWLTLPSAPLRQSFLSGRQSGDRFAWLVAFADPPPGSHRTPLRI